MYSLPTVEVRASPSANRRHGLPRPQWDGFLSGGHASTVPPHALPTGSDVVLEDGGAHPLVYLHGSYRSVGDLPDHR
jgi:hypothetical protein